MLRNKQTINEKRKNKLLQIITKRASEKQPGPSIPDTSQQNLININNLFNQHKDEIIKQPLKWWNSLTVEQQQLIKEQAIIWWNNLTPEQKALKQEAKLREQQEKIRKNIIQKEWKNLTLAEKQLLKEEATNWLNDFVKEMEGEKSNQQQHHNLANTTSKRLKSIRKTLPKLKWELHPYITNWNQSAIIPELPILTSNDLSEILTSITITPKTANNSFLFQREKLTEFYQEQEQELQAEVIEISSDEETTSHQIVTKRQKLATSFPLPEKQSQKNDYNFPSTSKSHVKNLEKIKEQDNKLTELSVLEVEQSLNSIPSIVADLANLDELDSWVDETTLLPKYNLDRGEETYYNTGQNSGSSSQNLDSSKKEEKSEQNQQKTQTQDTSRMPNYYEQQDNIYL